jgi:hypothetical protein
LIQSPSKSFRGKSGVCRSHFGSSLAIATKTNGSFNNVAVGNTVFKLCLSDPSGFAKRMKFKTYSFQLLIWWFFCYHSSETTDYFGSFLSPTSSGVILFPSSLVKSPLLVSLDIRRGFLLSFPTIQSHFPIMVTIRKNPYAKAPPAATALEDSKPPAKPSISGAHQHTSPLSSATSDTVTYAAVSTQVEPTSDDDDSFDDDEEFAQLPTLPTSAPALPSMNMLMQIHHTENDTSPGAWDLVGSGKFEKEQRKIFAPFSQQYLPRNLPQAASTDYVGILTTTVIPVTVQIRTPPKASHLGFKNARVLLAVLKLFQSAYADSYIGSVKGDKQLPRLIHPEHIPLDEVTLMQYMIKPIVATNRVYSTKVLIHTNHTLKEFKLDPNFRSYIGEEGIVIDHNTLATAIPTNIGFLENVIPRQDTLHLHHERISRYLPPGLPPFQVTLQKLYGKDTKWVNVIMLQSADTEVVLMNRHLLTAATVGGFKYFPFSAYTCLLPGQKLTDINELNMFCSAYRSVNLEGFKDYADDTCMRVIDPESQPDETTTLLATTTVSHYLRTYIYSATTAPLFVYVYPPSSTGVRKALCTSANYNDAKSFAEVMSGELARMMDKTSLKKVFLHPLAAIKLAKLERWKPFDRVTSIVETESVRSKGPSASRKKCF